MGVVASEVLRVVAHGILASERMRLALGEGSAFGECDAVAKSCTLATVQSATFLQCNVLRPRTCRVAVA